VTAVRAILLLLVFAHAAHAVPRRGPSEHFARGNELYGAGRYADAIQELEAGYAQDPRPEFLYALGQAERKLGNCGAALARYQAYLDTNPAPQRRDATQMQIDRCREEMGAAAPAPAPVAPAPVVEKPPAAPAPAPVHHPAPAPVHHEVAAAAPKHTPVYKRWWLWTTIIGVAAVGVGVGLGVGLTQKPSFDSTLPDFVVGRAAVTVRF
jgi:hypothetical protein